MAQNLNSEQLLEKPEPPEDWECCDSECGYTCVHEVYAREKQAYEEQQKRLAQLNQSD